MQKGTLSWPDVLLNMFKAVNQGETRAQLTLGRQNGAPGISLDLL